MTSQLPTFRLTVARQMEAYKERFAARLNAELIRRGEQPREMATALNIEPRTVERWAAGERFPQRRHLKAAADYLGVSVDELRPDLEAEERKLRDQLDRIEEKLDEVLEILKGAPAEGEDPEIPDALPDGPDRPPDEPAEDEHATG